MKYEFLFRVPGVICRRCAARDKERRQEKEAEEVFCSHPGNIVTHRSITRKVGPFDVQVLLKHSRYCLRGLLDVAYCLKSKIKRSISHCSSHFFLYSCLGGPPTRLVSLETFAGSYQSSLRLPSLLLSNRRISRPFKKSSQKFQTSSSLTLLTVFHLPVSVGARRLHFPRLKVRPRCQKIRHTVNELLESPIIVTNRREK